MLTVKRHLLFSLLIFLSFIVFYPPVKELIGLSLHDELYSHIPLIPLLSGCFLWARRKLIFSHLDHSFAAGAMMIGIGGILYAIGSMRIAGLDRNDHLSWLTFSALLVWIGIFIVFYGFQTFKRASFPLLFLLFIVPIPTVVMESVVQFLQKGSADAVSALFYVMGVPVTRDGFLFHFPRLTIEVAEQCSSIRSSIALLITGIVASNLFLYKWWARILLVMLIIPITILKNGIRIFVLSVWGVYVDTGIFDSNFHRKGGILFFILALFLTWVAIVLLRKVERDNPLP